MKKILTFILFFSTAIAIAQPSNPAEAVKNLIAGYGENHRKEQRYTDKGPTEPKDSLYYISESLEINYFLSQVFKTIFAEMRGFINLPTPNPLAKNDPKIPATLSDYALFTLFTATEQSVGVTVKNLTTPSITPTPMDFLASLAPQTGARQNVNIFSQSNIKSPPAVSSINLDSLITPVQYPKAPDGTSKPQRSALLFIDFVSGLAQPMPSLNLAFAKNEKERDDILNTPRVQEYYVALMRQIANYSIGISNLYYLYAERIPVPLQGKDVPSGLKLPEHLTKEASALALDQFAATRRIQSREWYQEMQTTTPATLQREMLYLLAEMRYELFQLRMVNERILVTQSALQISAAKDEQLNLQNMLRRICPTLPRGICPADATGMVLSPAQPQP